MPDAIIEITPDFVKFLERSVANSSITEEGRQAISRAHTGKTISKEHRQAISKANSGNSYAVGHTMSEEGRERISKVHTGKSFITEAGRYALSKAASGRVLSWETCQKISLANMGKPGTNRGKPLSKETKERLSRLALERGSTITEDGRRRLQEAGRGRTHTVSEEARQAISRAQTGVPNPEYQVREQSKNAQEWHRGHRHPMLGKHHTEEAKQLVSRANVGNQKAVGHIVSEEARKALSRANSGRIATVEQLEAIKQRTLETWASYTTEERDARLRAVGRGTKRGPTEPEWFLGLCLEKHWPGEWAYNGNCEQGVVLNSRTPDFVNRNGAKAVIEVFGSYYHDTFLFPHRETPEELIARYAKLGFKCLVLWDYECYDNPKLVERINDFCDCGKTIEGGLDNVLDY